MARGSSWRLFYRNLPNLPRSLRFRQNTRSTTRYIDRANAASLRSRLRARQEEEEARTSFADTMSPRQNADFRPMTDFEAQMANLQKDGSQGDSNAPAGASSFATSSAGGAGASAPSGIPTLASKLSQRLFGRTSSMFSIDSNQPHAADRVNYRVVKINGGGALREEEILSDVDESHPPGDEDDATSEEPLFASNEVKTSQYTWWSFVPVFLYLTFQKTANLYFLLIGIFQMIPDISPTEGVPLQFIPLAIVTVIDAVFAGFEDYKRHIADDLANSAKTQVFNRELREFEEVQWRDVKVGDFVKIRNHDTLPADILILSVVPAEGARSGGNTGVCYVETKNLDGETNLKLREAPQSTRSMFANEEDAGEITQGWVESELPNGDINRYSGTLYLEDNDSNDEVGVALTLKNMLLRGSKLRNTSYVYGLIVNTGVDSKIMMSSGDEFPVKISSIDEMTNKQVIMVVLMLLVMSLIGAIGDNIWMKDVKLPPYFTADDFDNKSIIGTFVYFFTTLASMVPITLYVSITLVKALQAYFMERDLDMYDAENDAPMIARNMQLNEQLGQISHIFSDKTGTLTCNKMEFRKCSINGESYGKGITAIGLAARLRDDFQGSKNIDESDDDTNSSSNGTEEDEYMQIPAPNVNFKDRRIWKHMRDEASGQGAKIREFFTHLALCHGVLIERIDTVPEGMEELPIQYSASSPDEQALVCGAKYFGYEFVARDPGSVSLKTPAGTVDQYDILEVFEFDSTRKRMSVIVQRRKTDEELMEMTEDDEDEVLVLTKGADSMLFPRLASDSISPTNAKTRETTLKNLETFAQDGLRTLVICSKKMTVKDWEEFHFRYRRACADLQEVDAKARGDKNAIDALQDELESDLELLGATAIEDRLQDGVPEAMEQLAKAGICIWVLTGDMEETAINIGYACRLLNNDMQRHVINSATYHTKGSILRQLDKVFHSIYDARDEDVHFVDGTSATPTHLPNPRKNPVEHALVIDGGCLNMILEDPLYNLHLLRVSLLCKVVVACRVSPQQKAQLVELVKLNVPDSHTLSIGDGANDVPMIQSAHIGIGISGQEGMQAVNSSDYALGQFRFLSTLLLVHGRWNYDRVAALTVYTFYKNIVYNVSMFWYTLNVSAYSGTMIYSALIQQGYNLIFTALPIMVYSVFDRDLPKEVVLKFPALYHSSTRKHSLFSYMMFWKWIVLGVIDSIGVFFFTLITVSNIMRNGESVEYTVLESVAWTVLCIVVSGRFCLMVNSWDVLEVVCMALTVMALYGFQYAIDLIEWSTPDYNTYTFPWIFARSGFWLGQLFAVVAILFKDYFYEACRRRFIPAYLDLVRETTVSSKATKGGNNDSEGAEASPSYEDLVQYKPPAANYLNPELANMMDYQERRVLDRVPIRYTTPGRESLYRGFAFDQPAHIVNWILTNGHNENGSSRRKGINVHVRQQILLSEDPVIFENERYQPFCGFGSTYPGYLLPTDRSRWSDRSGKLSAMMIPLAGLELNLDAPGCDEDGWVYAPDFSLFPSAPITTLSRRSSKDGVDSSVRASATSRKPGKRRGYQGFVRRREWVLSEKYKEMLEHDRLLRENNRLSNLSAVSVNDDEKEEL